MSATSRALVSIVIPYGGGNEGWLEDQIGAVVRSVDAWGGAAEIVLAANNETANQDATRAVAHASVRIVDASRRRGPSAARNDGAHATTGDILLFCDADDVVDTGWVAGMVRALEGADVVSGVKRYDELNDAEDARGWSSDNTALPTRYNHLPFAVSATLGIRRDVFDRVGGFDEALECGEDLDLCWRAQYAGASISLASDAVVQYRLRSGVRAQLQQTFRYGIGDARLFKKHRSHGASRRPKESVRAMAALARHTVGVATGPKRQRSAYWVGYHLGHIVGTVQHRAWVI